MIEELEKCENIFEMRAINSKYSKMMEKCCFLDERTITVNEIFESIFSQILQFYQTISTTPLHVAFNNKIFQETIESNEKSFRHYSKFLFEVFKKVADKGPRFDFVLVYNIVIYIIIIAFSYTT